MGRKIRVPGKSIFVTGIVVLMSILANTALGQLNDALSNGQVSGSFNLRYESVGQSNSLDDAMALTLSSKLSYSTAPVSGFSALLEVEDVRIVGGMDKYTVGPSGFNLGTYSTIADPETTELDQGYLQYSNGTFTSRIGRQVVVYDNHRFVGHVGWRQDRQTFDAISLAYAPNEKLSLNYNFLDERQRIFAEDADLDSKDHLFHASYDTDLGSLIAYAYLLELDNNTDNALDTYGLRFVGSKEIAGYNTNYLVEYASQESQAGPANFDANYMLLEGGLTVTGVVVKIGYEVLGSDDGRYGFSTPLSTLHAHNGWADLFLGTPTQGLVDTYLSVGGNAWNGNWLLIYHNLVADDPTIGVDDFGNELDLQYVFPVGENTNIGIKYANYSQGDLAAGKPETDKLWAWLTVRF